MKYELRDVIPQAQDILIAGKNYKLNVFTLDDAAYFDEKYGTAKFYLLMKTAPVAIFTEIAYKLITPCEWVTLTDFRKTMTPQEAAANDLIGKTMLTVGQSIAEVKEDGDDITVEGGDAIKAQTFQKNNILRKIILFIKSLLRFKRNGN